MNGQTERGEYDAILIQLCNEWRNSDVRADNKEVRKRVQQAFDKKDAEIARLKRENDLLEYAVKCHSKNLLEHSEAVNEQGDMIKTLREALGAVYESDVHEIGCSRGKYCTCFQLEVEAALAQMSAAPQISQEAEPGTSDASSPR